MKLFCVLQVEENFTPCVIQKTTGIHILQLTNADLSWIFHLRFQATAQTDQFDT